MVRVGDVERFPEEGNPRKPLTRIHGVLFHNRPFFFGEGAGLEEDPVGDTEFANVVEHGTAPDVDQILLRHPQPPGQLECQLGDPLGVARRLLVPELDRLAPAFQGEVVGHLELELGPPEVLEQPTVLDGDGPLGGQDVQKLLLFGREF